jgi:DNA-binding NtrC family response regulator
MKQTILMVHSEQNGEWAKLQAHLRRRKGFEFYTASTVQEAVKLIKNDRVHIVIADYDLPRDSLKFLKKIKSIKPFIEVIFLSEKATLGQAIKAMKAGAYDFYEFPVNRRLLVAVIDKSIEKQDLFFEKTGLEHQVQEIYDFSNIVGRSKELHHVLGIVQSIVSKNVTVLITGETGTGKELIANAIHFNSPRSSKPFIKVNCAAFNESVLESELFGHEKGSFTGAIATRIGRFELADSGSIFLDEVSDLSPAIQIKLLRVLQEKEFERVGGNETIKVDIRLIAASNRDLRKLVAGGTFREDLYYRLNVVNINMPALRDRIDDIPLLVSHFIHKLNIEKDYEMKGITRESMQILLNYSWPGNVRELENAIESSMALTKGNIIEVKYLPAFLLYNPSEPLEFYQIPKNLTLREIEKIVIDLTLNRTAGNKTKAAKLLNIGLRTLHRKVEK